MRKLIFPSVERDHARQHERKSDLLAVFERIRYRRQDGKVFLHAFDLIELDGDDLRREPLDVRKATLRRWTGSRPGPA
jgi:ATP-dependent DNA ligase